MSVFTENVYDTGQKRKVFVKHFCKKKIIIKIARFELRYTSYFIHIQMAYIEQGLTLPHSHVCDGNFQEKLQFDFPCILLCTFEKKNVGLFYQWAMCFILFFI